MNLRTTIQTFLDQTKAWAEPATCDSYKQKLERFATFVATRFPHAGLHLPYLSTAMLLEYKAALFRSGMKESSIASYFITLTLFLNWCVKTGGLAVNPMPRMGFVIPQADRKPITVQEYERLVVTADRIPDYEHWPEALGLAWHTGLRLSDIALLRNASLNAPGCAIRLVPKKTRRHARFVEIPIPEDLMDFLKIQSKGEYVFPTMAKMYKHDRHKTLSNQFSYIARKAKVKTSFHCFRHSFISRNLSDGVSPALISEMTGINLNQIMTYTHFSIETKRAALGLVKKKGEVA